MNQGMPLPNNQYNQSQNVDVSENYDNVVPHQNQIPPNVSYTSPLPDQQNMKGFNKNPQLRIKRNKGGMQNPMIMNTLYTIAQTRNQEDTIKNSSTKIDVSQNQFINQTNFYQKQQNIQTNAYMAPRNLSIQSSKQQLLKYQLIQSSKQFLRQNEAIKNVSNVQTPGIISEDTQNNMIYSTHTMKRSIPSGQIKSYGPNKVLGTICQFCNQQAEVKQNKTYGQAFVGWTILLCLIFPCFVWIPYCYEPCFDREIKCAKCRRIRNIIKSKWGCGY